MRTAIAAAVISVLCQAAASPDVRVIHAFCGMPQCRMGAPTPYAAPISDAEGNLYGTTNGSFGAGTIYKLSRGADGAWVETVLHRFCRQRACADGGAPQDQLILDTSGNLYGMTMAGEGSVFELTKNGEYRILHTFCAEPDCTDGSISAATLAYYGQSLGEPYDGASPLYATTANGGFAGLGTVFELKPPPAGETTWRHRVLYSFCRHEGGCPDAGYPASWLVVKTPDRLYGAAKHFGSYDHGAIFEIDRHADGLWSYTVLHHFKEAEGHGPIALVMDRAGVLYGIAESGGTRKCRAICGTAFRLVPDGEHSQFTTVHQFCSLPRCADGFNAGGSLVLGADGDVYGTAFAGGDTASNRVGGGVIFRLSGTNFSVVHAFPAAPAPDKSKMDDTEKLIWKAADEAAVFDLAAGTSGRIVGSASYDPVHGGGVVFELTP